MLLGEPVPPARPSGSPRASSGSPRPPYSWNCSWTVRGLFVDCSWPVVFADKKSVVFADKKSVVSADTTDVLSANTTDFLSANTTGFLWVAGCGGGDLGFDKYASPGQTDLSFGPVSRRKWAVFWVGLAQRGHTKIFGGGGPGRAWLGTQKMGAKIMKLL